MRKTQQEREDELLLTCSIERVINESMRILQNKREWDNLQDWEDCKLMVVKLWNEARNEAFIRTQNSS